MRSLIVPIVLAFLGASACTNTPNTATGKSNSDLENSIKSKLATEPELAKDISVDANADKNTATLSGTVATEQLRERAVSMAKSTAPGLEVTDKIDVKPREATRSEYTDDMARQARERAKTNGESIGNSTDDAWIHTKITAKLIGNSATPARKINVDVVNGVVTLRGQVESAAAKTEASRMAQETDGVKQVRNQLKVITG